MLGDQTKEGLMRGKAADEGSGKWEGRTGLKFSLGPI